MPSCKKCLRPTIYYDKLVAYGREEVDLVQLYYCTLCGSITKVEQKINVWELWEEE